MAMIIKSNTPIIQILLHMQQEGVRSRIFNFGNGDKFVVSILVKRKKYV